MKINTLIKTLASVAVLTVASNGAWAAGTTAGTSIDNTAEITYTVGGTAQTEIESSPTGNTTAGDSNGTATTFIVDKKIDLTVTPPSSTTNVIPGTEASAPNTLVYILENEGNSTEYFKLSTSDSIGSDDFNVSGCTIASATPLASAQVGPVVIQLAPDATSNITVACAVPLTPTNTQTSNVDLHAVAVTTLAGSTNYAGTETDTTGCPAGAVAEWCTLDTILADGNATTTESLTTDGATRNAAHSAIASYTVSTAALTVQKTQVVTSMGFDLDDEAATTASGNTTGDEENVAGGFHIPGSTITYTIVVSNTGQDATHLKITDNLPSDMTFVSCAVTGDGVVNATAPDQDLAIGCSAEGSTSFTLPAGSATLTVTARVK